MRSFSWITVAFLLVALFAGRDGHAQVVTNEAEYSAAKLQQALAAGAVIAPPSHPSATPPAGGDERGGGTNECNCWIQPDASYTTVDNNTQWNAGGFQNGDDGSYGPILLPFNFDLYGDQYNSVYININGNVSFGNYYGTFTSSGFPSAAVVMVAPFWADVDLRVPGVGINRVSYKVTPTAFYVNWESVGYYSQQTDKLNTFQLIITDGTDPVIGVDKNVSFCYQDMQWTTGSASGGIGGFGGTASTVGANRGNNIDFIQFTRNDHAGTDYDGPFANPDGVSWLDFKNFVFTTITNTQNIPPIAAGLYLCDTLRACIGQTAQLEVTFLSPENGQTTTATSSAPDLIGWTEIANISGIAASVTGEFTPTAGEEGFHLVTFQGTDDGTPNLTTTIQIVIEVIQPPSDPPGITGNAAICTGQTTTLTATGPFSSFVWSTGQSGQTITVGAPGSYTVTGGVGLCQLTSDPFTITEVTPPPLSISGPAEYCGTPLPELVASPGYEEYTWSNSATGDTVAVSAGVYTVTGLFQGCENVSAPFTMTLNDPGPPVITGALAYCEGGNTTLSVNAAPYESVVWSTNEVTPSIIATTGTYTVTATILNCTYTSTPVTVDEIILPPVTITGDAVYCADGIATISATPGFDAYVWNNNSFGQTINVQAGSYFVAASIGPCTTFSNTFAVTASPNPVPLITGPTFSCGGTPVVLTTTEAFANYIWSTGAQTPSISVPSGNYTVMVTDTLGCSGTSDPYGVVVASDPVAHFSTTPASPQPMGASVFFEDGSTVNGSSITSWDWIFDNTGGGSSAQSPTWTYPNPGDYTVTLTVTTADGCSDSFSMVYTIFPPDITIPNVISPNGDNANDVFEITNIIYWTNELKIYSRWGNVVYETRNYKNTWKADGVPDGTYYYVLTLGDGREWAGALTILR